jgi:osmotically-inducible protein OsmY
MKNATQVTHRPDAEIFVAVRSALDQNPAVPAAVRVHVKEGIVTLTGSVRTPADRMAAEETARGVDTVRDVVNDIFVVSIPAEGFEPPDA